jgi:hypothetical protein
MMTIYAVFKLTVLSICARIESGEEGNGFLLLFRRFVVVLKAAIISFGTWAPQIVVVAQLIIFFPRLDLVHDRFRIQNRRIEAAGSWVPRWR